MAAIPSDEREILDFLSGVADNPAAYARRVRFMKLGQRPHKGDRLAADTPAGVPTTHQLWCDRNDIISLCNRGFIDGSISPIANAVDRLTIAQAGRDLQARGYRVRFDSAILIAHQHLGRDAANAGMRCIII